MPKSVQPTSHADKVFGFQRNRWPQTSLNCWWLKCTYIYIYIYICSYFVTDQAVEPGFFVPISFQIMSERSVSIAPFLLRRTASVPMASLNSPMVSVP